MFAVLIANMFFFPTQQEKNELNLAIFAIIAVPVALSIIALVIIGCVHRAQAEWRLDQIRKNPKAYRLYREWEQKRDAKIEEGYDRSRRTAARAAGIGLKGAALVAKAILRNRR